MTTIYHNPRCSKSRQTLQLLLDHGLEPVIVEYLKNPPSETELLEIIRLLGIEPRELIREKEFSQLSLDPHHTPQQLVQIMVSHPQIIQRPIVIHGSKACIGRPPENVLEIIEF